MRIRIYLVSILINMILALVVVLILTCENELNNFDLFIESINNNPIRVYAVTLPTTAEPVFIQNELNTEEEKKFIQFLSSSKEIPSPSAGILRDVYDFQIHEKTRKSTTRTWDIQAKIVLETKICQFWISGGLKWVPLYHSALDERLSEEFRSYLVSLGLEN